MGETLGRGRRERGNEGDVVACPEISMGGVFNRDPYQGTWGTAPNEAPGPGFWKLERTTLVSREPPTAEDEFGTMAPSQGDGTSPKPMSNNSNGLFGSTPALSRVLRIASDTCKSVYNMWSPNKRAKEDPSDRTEMPKLNLDGLAAGRRSSIAQHTEEEGIKCPGTGEEGQQKQESHHRAGGRLQRKVVPGSKESGEGNGDEDHQRSNE